MVFPFTFQYFVSPLSSQEYSCFSVDFNKHTALHMMSNRLTVELMGQGQLSHYVTGHRKPGKKTTEKIEKRLKEFAKDLQQIDFV